jgi:CHAT domain-containing protein/tetratricopeptide (TPR) repeat protein
MHFHRMDEFRKALKYYEKALSRFLDAGEKHLAGECYCKMAMAYLSLGRYQLALEYGEKAATINEQIGDKRLEAFAQMTFGDIDSSLGEHHKALKRYENALTILKENGFQDIEEEAELYRLIGMSNVKLGKHLEGLGDVAGALALFEKASNQALDYSRRSYFAAKAATCYSEIGTISLMLQNYENALEYFNRAIGTLGDNGDIRGMMNCYANIAFAYYSIGDREKAFTHAEKALLKSEQIGYKSGAIDCRWNLAILHIGTNNALAHEYLKEAIRLSEEMFEELMVERHMLSFLSGYSDFYHLMVPLCNELEKYDEAFEYAERAKSRVFVRMMAASEIRPKIDLPENVKPLLQQEADIIGRIRQMQLQSTAGTGAKSDAVGMDRARQQLDDIYSRIEAYDPEYVSLRRPKPITVAQLQKELSKTNGIVVEYFTTPEKLIIFVISKTGLLVKAVDLTEEQLSKFVGDFKSQVAQYNKTFDTNTSWLGISEYLIEPVKEHILQSDLVYFVPHGLLHYLPLHALKIDGEYLITKKPVVYSPSSSLLPFYKKAGSNKYDSSVSFGADVQADDESFDKEAEEIAELLHGRHVTKPTLEEVLRNLEGSDILHFSCHGFFSKKDPLSSGIMLHGTRHKHPEGYTFDVITARRMFKLDKNLGAELVMLSACQTGVNENKPGDELIGLTRALLYRGAASVIVGLWEVPSDATEALTKAFYQELKYGKQPKAVALQKAMIKTMKSGIVGGHDWSHPYFWAPFVLVGDWE